MNLKVRLLMLLYVDNKVVKNICFNWSDSRRTCHIKVKQYLLQDFKEEGQIQSVWQAGTDTTSDLFTKNLSGPLFTTHRQHLVSGPYLHSVGDMDISDHNFCD